MDRIKLSEISCRKCGAFGTVEIQWQPARRWPRRPERLRFTCLFCHGKWYTPTVDQTSKAAQEPRAE